MKKNHKIKIHQEYYNAILEGNKTAEIRFNDRNYEVGDTINFHHVDNSFAIDGRTWVITHVCSFLGLVEGYVMLSITGTAKQ